MARLGGITMSDYKCEIPFSGGLINLDALEEFIKSTEQKGYEWRLIGERFKDRSGIRITVKVIKEHFVPPVVEDADCELP
jgi:hypothetical protein